MRTNGYVGREARHVEARGGEARGADLGGADTSGAGNRRSVADGARLVARTLVYVVVGGVALVVIATVGTVLGPMVALDIATPAVAAWWTA
ncbi:hypothetical protein O3Q52_44725 [Streptomyces sp. ActVer]|uniref:hypothetical protein n=1 Tax=Streptomyces sp. ActVer TaxID=3014558 RepID=UPI0022B5AEA3|nr:hypothetical protein [Streptomyces sp. ActVer]MCZ4515105.1 hypothetical protein [Streptomyces sp. ActVer]